MRKYLPEILAVLAIIIVGLLLLHQKYFHNYWFSRASFFHHETAEAAFVAAAIGLLLGKYLGRGG